MIKSTLIYHQKHLLTKWNALKDRKTKSINSVRKNQIRYLVRNRKSNLNRASLSNVRTCKQNKRPSVCIQNFRTSLEKSVPKYRELEGHKQKVVSQSPQLLASRDIDCKKYRQTDKLTACIQRGIVFRVIFVFGLCFADRSLRFGIVPAN